MDNNSMNNNISISENDNTYWGLIVKYYKQVILILLIFIIIYVIEYINVHNSSQGAVSMIPGLMTAAAPIIKKKIKKGKK